MKLNKHFKLIDFLKNPSRKPKPQIYQTMNPNHEIKSNERKFLPQIVKLGVLGELSHFPDVFPLGPASRRRLVLLSQKRAATGTHGGDGARQEERKKKKGGVGW